MVFLKRLWAFFADLSGVIATIGYAVIGIGFLSGWLVEHKRVLLLFLFILPFVIFSALKWFSSSYKKFLQKITNIDIDEEIIKFEKTKPNHDINKMLPSNSLIYKLGDSLIKKVKGWADDGKVETLTLYIDVNNVKVNLSLQALCKSQWKNEEAYLWVGKNYGISPREVSTRNVFSSQDVTPFYKACPNWRKAIIKAYEAIKDKLPDEFKLIICSHFHEVFHFEFSYKSGIERNEEFELKDDMLKNLKSGKTIAL